jgi:hypothetical protein
MKADTKFIALDRARSTLHLLKKSNIEVGQSLFSAMCMYHSPMLHWIIIRVVTA